MRPPVGAVVPAQRTLAQGSTDHMTDRGQVVDLRCEGGAGPQAPRRCDLASVGRDLVDAPGTLAPHELGLQPVDTRGPSLALIVFRQLPESPFAVGARPAVLSGVPAFTGRLVSICTRWCRQLLVVNLGSGATLQSVLGG